MRARELFGMLVAGLMLTACSQQVVLHQEFPEPVMRKIDRPVSLYLPAELRNHVHVEEPEYSPLWTIEFAEANPRLFHSVLSGMFAELQVSTDLASVPDNATLLTPAMKDFQFSTPGMSKTDFYEVWIKYTLTLSHPKNRALVEWPFTAYGREEKSGQSASAAMREAARRAMRDAAAAVVLNFPKQPAFRAHFALDATTER